ncbi:hypothetical protein Fmac_017998 [Flemingia macrophylla]|uniref:Plant heme peroxidase family profile domain-containing protein n=1 Tax=Flemingia macrophylla TaxID=520843 RepID=A0ABD1M3P9_9FABA
MLPKWRVLGLDGPHKGTALRVAEPEIKGQSVGEEGGQNLGLDLFVGLGGNFYIVFLGANAESRDNAHETYLNVLSAVKGSYLEAKESMVYSYSKNFNAFAAKLSKNEANKLSATDEVLFMFQNQYRQLHTTRSWNFIGLPPTAKRRLKLESDIVVALLDTGAKYFKGDGNPDPSDILSPVDVDGHGTHTASTAAGNLVPNATLFGLANGTARGAVPLARLAIYKVCWSSSGCADIDILAAFDAAIHDGVDVISISIGGGSPSYVEDSISIGAFHAMRKGIITAASAGNDGPNPGSLTNTAPWIVTVAASGIDRAFKSTVQLGNGKNVSGVGVSCFDPKQKQYPLINGTDAAKSSKEKENARFCYEDSLEPNKVKGKLVYCQLGRWGTDSVVKGIGGIGTLIESDDYPDVAQIFMAPATIVNSGTALIYKSREVQIQAPFIATFSSRGPNPGSQNVLKPDVAAPGIDILASYTLKKSLTGLKGDTQFSEFILLSGTSMACPHVAGVAAYVKSFHPHWTPAAIRSAIITTAKPMSKRVNNEAEFAYGSGQLNPSRAVSPGLVYDMDDIGYVQFLCHEGYNGSTLSPLVGSRVNCSSLVPGLGHDAINYPTMQLSLQSNKSTRVGVFRRRVTNVGPVPTIYNATIISPKGVEITVKPTSLSFSKTSQKRSFNVVVKVKSIGTFSVRVWPYLELQISELDVLGASGKIRNTSTISLLEEKPSSDVKDV